MVKKPFNEPQQHMPHLAPLFNPTTTPQKSAAFVSLVLSRRMTIERSLPAAHPKGAVQHRPHANAACTAVIVTLNPHTNLQQHPPHPHFGNPIPTLHPTL